VIGRSRVVWALVGLVACGLVAMPSLVSSASAAAPRSPSASEEKASGSCGTVPVDHGDAVKVSGLKGQASCSSARSIAKTYGHPKAVKTSCHPSGRECEYGVYAEAWRCTGIFQGGFYCWLGGDAKGRGARASFYGLIISGRLLDLAEHRPPCTRHALTKGLREGGLGAQIDRDAFGCAGHFAWAGAIVHHDGTGDEITVLLKAGRGSWHPVSRGRFCEDGAVPKTIYQPACKSN
jgi:hypothetical protein